MVGNADPHAVLDVEGEIQVEAAETFGEEENVRVADFAWLSRKEILNITDEELKLSSGKVVK
jgi:hypothetical protein